MRTAILIFEHQTVAVACGAPGHMMSAAFAIDPTERVLERLGQVLSAYEPERVMLSGRNSVAAAVELWLSQRGQAFGRMPAGDIEQMAEALKADATYLDLLDEDAQFEDCRPGEAEAIAALELQHRLTVWPAEKLSFGGLYR